MRVKLNAVANGMGNVYKILVTGLLIYELIKFRITGKSNYVPKKKTYKF